MSNMFQQLLEQLYPGRGRMTRANQQYHVSREEGKTSSVKKGTGSKTIDERFLKAQGESAIHKRERIQEEVEKEDFLLSQIDEFREKAMQLQTLLALKENKVQELQTIVNEREDKAQELQCILTERQEEADKIVTEFTKKVDELAGRVTSKMDEIEHSISGQVTEVKRASEQQLAANRNLNEEQIAANKKLTEEQLTTNKQFLEEQAIANKKLSEGQIAEVKVLLETATAQLEEIKTELSEKVHSENVKCYRNIQELFNEFDSKIEKMDAMEKGVSQVRGYLKCLSWFSVLNFVLLIGYILYALGVFNF